MNDDDTLWVDGLAGRADADSPTAREGLALRAALRSGMTPRVIADLNAALPDLAREAALVERAKRDGLIEARASARRARFSPRWMSVAASVLLVIGAVVVVQLRAPPRPDVIRGGTDGVVRLTAADPAALKQRILHELRAVGVEATGYEALGAHGVDADLPLPLTDAVKKVLAAHDIPEPADGSLRIEIRSPQ